MGESDDLETPPQELIEAFRAARLKPNTSLECARVAQRLAAAAVEAERRETLIVAEQVLGPVAARHLAEALDEAATSVPDPETDC